MAIRFHSSLFSLVLAVCFLFPQVSIALTVTNLNDDGPGSLRDAIANTPQGRTVDFSVTGVIELASELVIDKDITILGPGAGQLTVSGDNTTRIFNITGGINIKISHITIADGFIDSGLPFGSAIVVTSAQLNMELSDCVIENNTNNAPGFAGGTVVVLNGDSNSQNILKINRCSFINNRVESSTVQGGVFAANSGFVTFEVYDSLFKGNVAQGFSVAQGGVVMTALGVNFICTNCTFDSNVARTEVGAVFGGAVLIAGDGVLQFTNSTFYNNRAACANDDGIGCSVFGGAIASAGSGEFSCDFCTFQSNGVICDSTVCDIAGDTISNNSITSFELSNSIFSAENPEGSCANLSGGEIISLGYNIDNGNTCAGGGAGDKTITDPGLDPLGPQDNGGPTPTIALMPGSPAVDMADPDCPPPDTDQRGVTRPQGTRCDIGAFELELIVRPIPTLSEWGLLAAAVLLGIAGLLAVRRKKAAM